MSVLKDTLKLFENRLVEAHIRLEVDLSAGKKITLPADVDRLAQLYSNLLENTIRYVDKPGELKIWYEQSKENLMIYFEDSGPGVPEESVAHLFDRLYRVDTARSRAMGGSGLGLAICKAIAEAHGGEITAVNSPTGGLKIEILLPIHSNTTHQER
jgi:two-component system sensor histidine kinase BaeS